MIDNFKKDKDDEAMLENIALMLKKYSPQRNNLIAILQAIQDEFQYLSSKAIKKVAEFLDITSCEVYGVSTFYNQFRYNPPGKNQIKVCLGTACHVRGGDIILENFERKLDIKSGETTENKEFSIDKVACIGCCALAPVAVVNDQIHAYVTPSKIEGIFLGFELEKQIKDSKNHSEDLDSKDLKEREDNQIELN